MCRSPYRITDLIEFQDHEIKRETDGKSIDEQV